MSVVKTLVAAKLKLTTSNLAEMVKVLARMVILEMDQIGRNTHMQCCVNENSAAITPSFFKRNKKMGFVLITPKL